MIHDCIYQFLRLFYHSRFKPQQLEMTLSQLSAPVLDLVLVLPLILRLYKDLLRFSNETKLRVQSKPEIVTWQSAVRPNSVDPVRGSLVKVSFILTILLIFNCMSHQRENKTFNSLSSKDLSANSCYWDKSQGSMDPLFTCLHVQWSIVSWNVSYSLDGYYDENSSPSRFHSSETNWIFYWFHAWSFKFKCRRRNKFQNSQSQGFMDLNLKSL